MSTAADLSGAGSAAQGLIKFEQPLNERMRTFLRIEFLYEQTLFHVGDPSSFGARAAIAALLEVLTILGRSDVRADVMKELERHGENLKRFQSQPGVDGTRLDELIADVDTLRAQLAEAGPHIVHPLKECDFLTTIRHRSSIPGGTCMFDLPDYGYWLCLSEHERSYQLEEWTNLLKPICEAVAEVLWLTREATVPVERVANGGLYQHSFDRTEQMSLVRVFVPASAGVFPEISAGQHRFTVRFLRWRGVDSRAAPVTQDTRFSLAVC